RISVTARIVSVNAASTAASTSPPARAGRGTGQARPSRSVGGMDCATYFGTPRGPMKSVDYTASISLNSTRPLRPEDPSLMNALQSLIKTGTKLYLDSVDPEEVAKNLQWGAVGATSNPVIISEIVARGSLDSEI